MDTELQAKDTQMDFQPGTNLSSGCLSGKHSDRGSDTTLGGNVPGDQLSTKSTRVEEVANTEITGLKLILVHASLCLCTFVTGLDVNIVATAIPTITSQFHSLDDVGWYGSAFYIALCASQPVAGKLYTLFPKKWVFLSYMAVFMIGSLVCGLAPTSTALIVGRAIAGLGTSGIFAGSLSIVSTIIPLAKRAIWLGLLNSTFAVASILGPVISGLLTQHVTWRWCFYINLPIGGAGAVVVLLLLHLKSASTEDQPLSQKIKGLDFLGFALFGGAMAMLILALEWGGVDHPWSSSVIIGLFVGFGVSLIVFIAWQISIKDAALIPPKIFATRNATLIIISSFFVNGPFQIIIYYLPIWFQAVLGVSPSASGVRYLPTVISDVVTSVVAMGIVTKLGIWNPFLLSGEVLVCVAGGLLSTLFPTISDGHWIGYQILGGVGFSLALSMAFLGIQASIPAAEVPIGNSTLLTMISASCTIFLSIGQVIFSHKLLNNLSNTVSTTEAYEILTAGATEIRSVVPSTQLPTVIKAYSNAITTCFYLPAFAPIVSFILVLGCKWISTKQETVQTSEGKTNTAGNEEKDQAV